jgi:hypothetical protein
MTESPRTFRTTFTNADLRDGIYTVTHNLNQQFVFVQVSDSDNKVVAPDDIIFISTTQAAIDLGGYGALSGNWNALVIG